METKRIEALADGVFAIAMTLLVLEIRVPELDHASGTALWQALVALGPRVAGYVVSFVILGTLWIGHHNQFAHIRRADRTLLWINVFYLLTIGFLPFSTALLSRYGDQPLAGAVYGGNLLLAGVFLWAHWVYGTSGRRLVSPDLDQGVVHAARRRIELGFIVYLAAIVIGFWSMPVGLTLFALMPVLYMLPGRIDRHLR